MEVGTTLGRPEIYVPHAPITKYDNRDNQFPKLRMVFSAHVDDLKGGASMQDATNFLKFLESNLGNANQNSRNLYIRE